MKMISSTSTTSTRGVTFMAGATRFPDWPTVIAMSASPRLRPLVDHQGDARESDLLRMPEQIAHPPVAHAPIPLEHQSSGRRLVVGLAQPRQELALGDHFLLQQVAPREGDGEDGRLQL